MRIRWTLLILVSLGLLSDADCAEILIDFGDGTNGLQGGFTQQAAADVSYPFESGTLTVDLPVGALIISRGQPGPIASSGSALVSNGTNIIDLQNDFVFAGIAGDFMDITVSGITAGTYNFEGWFADPGDLVNEADQQITLSEDGGGSFSLVNAAVDATGSNASPESFSFSANGTDDVIIRVTEANGFNQLRMNGFAISSTPVPEPHSIALWILLGLASVGFAAWRRRK